MKKGVTLKVATPPYYQGFSTKIPPGALSTCQINVSMLTAGFLLFQKRLRGLGLISHVLSFKGTFFPQDILDDIITSFKVVKCWKVNHT